MCLCDLEIKKRRNNKVRVGVSEWVGQRLCVQVCERERERVWVWTKGCLRERKRQRERKHVWVQILARGNKKEDMTFGLIRNRKSYNDHVKNEIAKNPLYLSKINN